MGFSTIVSCNGKRAGNLIYPPFLGNELQSNFTIGRQGDKYMLDSLPVYNAPLSNDKRQKDGWIDSRRLRYLQKVGRAIPITVKRMQRIRPYLAVIRYAITV